MNKKILSLFLAVAVSGIAISQSQKVAQNLGQGIDAITHHPNPTKGFVIAEEDFANGIPATWSNVTVEGPVDWKYTTVGHTGDFPTATLQSSTNSNGWIIVDSDADNFSGGGAEDAQLTTDIIDCSGYTNVKVEFQQMFRRWQQDSTIVRVTTDGGVTFTEYLLNASITQAGTDNPDFVNIDISSAITGNPANVQVQFRWRGAWDYGWQIDDFAVKEIDPNDILIKKAGLSEDVTYYMVPESQIQPLNFNAFAENIGFNDQTNVVLDADVMNGGVSVFTGSSTPLSNLASGVSDSLFLSTTYTPVGIGTYNVDLSVSQTETDDELGNNSKALSVEITDSVYAIDNGEYGGQWWNLDDGSGSSNAFEIGALYECVGNDDATSISVFVGDQSTIGALFELYFYSYDAAGETYNIEETSDSYVIDVNDLGSWVTVPLLNPVSITAGTDYLVSLNHFGGPDAIYVGYSTNSSFRGSTLSNDGAGAAWSNQPRTPMIRLNVGELDDSNVDELDFELSVYPNPIQDGVLNISSEDLYGEYEVVITDVNGRRLLNLQSQKVINIENLDSGFYTVRISQKGKSTTKRFIVR